MFVNLRNGRRPNNFGCIYKTLFAIALFAGSAMAQSPGEAKLPAIAPPPPVKPDGTITTPSFELPFSSFASQQARDALVRRLSGPPIGSAWMSGDMAARRRSVDEKFFGPQLAKAKALYPYTSSKAAIAGVPTETFEPTAGITQENRERVLINLHGGGFMVGGGGIAGAVESVPIAGVGRIKVISVDYRMAPEHRFPAATDDVVAVYRELLKSYEPANIGIYGCSAGGMLTGQTVARLQKDGLPPPGAIGIFCASTHRIDDGDSGHIAPRFGSVLSMIPAKDDKRADITPYFADTSPTDPLVLPSASKDVLKAFPPTLFLTGTRAPEMSGAAQSHIELRELGVRSELLLFDGMDHGFLGDADLPESQRAYQLIVNFFAEHLGRRGK